MVSLPRAIGLIPTNGHGDALRSFPYRARAAFRVCRLRSFEYRFRASVFPSHRLGDRWRHGLPGRPQSRLKQCKFSDRALCLPFNPSRCSEDRLRPFVKAAGPWLRTWTTCSVWSVRRKAEEDRGNRADRPTGDFRVAAQPAGRKDLTPPGVCSDDGGRRPWASRRSGLGRGAPPVWAPGRPCPGRGVFGPRGSR